MSATMTSLAEMLARRAQMPVEFDAYTFLSDEESAAQTLSYTDLHLRAQALAVRLRERLPLGSRVLLLLPPGRAYLEAVFGCFYAGVVGVSAAPPQPRRLHRTLPRLVAIAADAQVGGVLTTAELHDAARSLLADGPLAEAEWFVPPSDAENKATDIEWAIPSARPDDVAFLQYTSGSTAQPRGVMLTHANLATNLELISQLFDARSAAARGGKLLIWLPPYHDMGLIGGLLQTVHVGFPVLLMSPIDVIRRPERWLQAISRHRVTVTGGPNFAYDLCVRRIRPEVREQLDLSCWEVAFNGAEPIRASTIARFSETFRPYGFRRSAFLTCYGLAEATLLVTGDKLEHGPTVTSFDHDELGQGRLVPPSHGDDATRLVGCGGVCEGHEVAVVDPQTLERCRPGEIGEIWVSGPSVARGYWNNEESTRSTFHAQILGEDGLEFLRTGDLGAFHEGELFVTGRIKELIVLNGRNVHPHDLEECAETAHPDVRQHCGAAFGFEDCGRTRVAIVLEVDPATTAAPAEVMRAVRRALVGDLDVQIHWIALVAPGTVAKTTSGKIQRTLMRELLVSGELETLAVWRPGET